jgi:hypothetical protein
MSDTKWRKLFAALNDAQIELEQIEIKFIDVSSAALMRMPSAAALCTPRPYIDTFEFGPIELRSIEWLGIPAVAKWARPNNLPAAVVAQDVGAARAIIEKLGKFPIEQTRAGLRILGYSG